jgi:hypothetical protein
MKIKIIILLTVLLNFTLAASPNKCGKGKPCTIGKLSTPVRTMVMMIDEAELLPMHHYLNKF